MNLVQMSFEGGIIVSRVIDNPKQLILTKAKEILYSEGYSKLSMRTLSKACDIALGTIYNYYPTKQQLVIEMMSEYWHNYLYSAEKIAGSNLELYSKLNNVFNELKDFIISFRQYWLTPELYESPEYTKGGLRQEYAFIEKLVSIIEGILAEEQSVRNLQTKLSTYETANFITMNFITLIQMPLFKYSTFELALKELL